MSKNEADRVESEATRQHAPALATVCAAGGLLAAFGLASCRALPMLLAGLGLGLGSTALVAIAVLAAPHRLLLLAIAALALSATAALWLWSRRRPALRASPPRSRSALTPISVGMAAFAIVLLALALWVEPPL
jgi:mercuric ion transport protein